MKAILPLSIVCLVIGFLLGVLGSFPIHGQAASLPETDTNVDTFSQEAVQEVGNRFSSMYSSVLEDLVSFQGDPDYQRAETQRQALVHYADLLIPQFQGLANDLQGELDELTAEAMEQTQSTTQ